MGKKEEKIEKKRMIMSLFVLAIMVFSVMGFALMMGGGSSSSTNPQELPLQQMSDPNSGQQFWGAIRNGEQFIYMDIVGYENNTEMANLAQSIKSFQNINIYVDEGFNSSDSLYIVEKSLRGIKVEFSRVAQSSCESNTLVFTTNATGFTGDCMVFESDLGSAYMQAEVLSYHLIKS